MEARATKALSRFNLDFDGEAVSSVRVDGRAADFRVDDEGSPRSRRASP